MTQQFHFWASIWKTMKTLTQKDICTYVQCSTVYNSQDTELTQVSIDGWMDKENSHTHNGILFNYKKRKQSRHFDNIDGPWQHYAKWNKSDGER